MKVSEQESALPRTYATENTLFNKVLQSVDTLKREYLYRRFGLQLARRVLDDGLANEGVSTFVQSPCRQIRGPATQNIPREPLGRLAGDVLCRD